MCLRLVDASRMLWCYTSWTSVLWQWKINTGLRCGASVISMPSGVRGSCLLIVMVGAWFALSCIPALLTIPHDVLPPCLPLCCRVRAWIGAGSSSPLCVVLYEYLYSTRFYGSSTAQRRRSACCVGPQQGTSVPMPRSLPSPPFSQGTGRLRERGCVSPQSCSTAVAGWRHLCIRGAIVLAGEHNAAAAVLLRAAVTVVPSVLEWEPGLSVRAVARFMPSEILGVCPVSRRQPLSGARVRPCRSSRPQPPYLWPHRSGA
ncbi:hypothetical protein NDU88_007948 [Pleurodeles waltl]|uniref:Uncharacterized protein n=1 Tax=Pleurodeles waltl TaxID=8319 RepID=A0AAV7NZD7_PLEWA|nr:hypothetical protein NDU88_007948 [Pleurodeles waltl]